MSHLKVHNPEQFALFGAVLVVVTIAAIVASLALSRRLLETPASGRAAPNFGVPSAKVAQILATLALTMAGTRAALAAVTAPLAGDVRPWLAENFLPNPGVVRVCGFAFGSAPHRAFSDRISATPAAVFPFFFFLKAPLSDCVALLCLFISLLGNKVGKRCSKTGCSIARRT